MPAQRARLRGVVRSVPTTRRAFPVTRRGNWPTTSSVRLSFDPRLRLREPVLLPRVEPHVVEVPAPRPVEAPPETPAEEPAAPASDLLSLLAASAPAQELAEPLLVADEDEAARRERVSTARIALRLSRLGSIAVSLHQAGAEPLQVEIVLSDPAAAAVVRARASELALELAAPPGVRLRIRSGVELDSMPPAGPSSLELRA